MQLGLIIFCFVCLGLLAVFIWPRKINHLSVEEEVCAKTVLKSIDDCDVEVEEFGASWGSESEGVDVPRTRRRVYRREHAQFIGACVNAAKAEFGIPVDNIANRLVLRKFIREKMVARGMRPTHVMQFLDLAIEGVFVPSKNELHAIKMRASKAWTLRGAVSEQSWVGLISDLPRWLGGPGQEATISAHGHRGG